MIRLLLMFAIVGIVARFLVSGTSVKGCLPTVLVGLAGSFVGGFLGYLIFGKDAESGGVQLAGFLGSLIGAVIVLLLYRKFADKRT